MAWRTYVDESGNLQMADSDLATTAWTAKRTVLPAFVGNIETPDSGVLAINEVYIAITYSAGVWTHIAGYKLTSTGPDTFEEIWKIESTAAGVTTANFAGVDKFRLPVKATTGHPAAPDEGEVEINTFDNKIYVYADADWRQLATW